MLFTDQVYISRVTQRLEKLIDKSCGPAACWLWLGYFSSTNYGRICINGRHMKASRAVLKFIAGVDVPKNKVVMHICDNTRCVNPCHLVVGTQKQNIYDAMRKQRHIANKELLTNEQLLEIRELYTTKNISQQELAKKYSVSNQLISLIILRKGAYQWR